MVISIPKQIAMEKYVDKYLHSSATMIIRNILIFLGVHFLSLSNKDSKTCPLISTHPEVIFVFIRID